mgnify:CR=1 FL=1
MHSASAIICWPRLNSTSNIARYIIIYVFISNGEMPKYLSDCPNMWICTNIYGIGISTSFIFPSLHKLLINIFPYRGGLTGTSCVTWSSSLLILTMWICTNIYGIGISTSYIFPSPHTLLINSFHIEEG